jgi:uncharacterized membrane protein YeiH
MLWAVYMVGTAVFAVTGAIAALRRGLDVFGVVVIAIVTAVGGGTLRDLLLGATPVFWVRDVDYVWVATAAALFTAALLGAPRTRPITEGALARVERALLYFDAAGLAVFTLGGVDRATAFGAPPVVAVMMGVMTGSAGSIVRDVLCNEVPLLLQREIYATAALLGAALYLALRALGADTHLALGAGMAFIFGLRAIAIRHGLSLRGFRLQRDTTQP